MNDKKATTRVKTVTEVHISEVRHGDTIIHNGLERTLSREYMSICFEGRSIWGDSYRSGTVPVKVVTWEPV